MFSNEKQFILKHHLGHSQAAFTLRGGIHKNAPKWASLGLIIEDHKDGQKGSKSAYNLLDKWKPKIFYCFCHAKSSRPSPN